MWEGVATSVLQKVGQILFVVVSSCDTTLR